MKLIILANRLPVRIEKDEYGKFTVTPSEGGLATGLGSLETKAEKIWVGWPGIFTDDEKEKICEIMLNNRNKENNGIIENVSKAQELFYEASLIYSLKIGNVFHNA